MDEPVRFITRVVAGDGDMTALRREHAISRKTGYKWPGGYRRKGCRCRGWANGRLTRYRHGGSREPGVVEALLDLRRG